MAIRSEYYIMAKCVVNDVYLVLHTIHSRSA